MTLRDIPLAMAALALFTSTLTSLPLPVNAAEPPAQPNAAELARAIDRLSVVGNVLYVAAHPDDENTRLLSYLSGEWLLRTAYLSLTRGDGGQNLIGAEQGPLLGLIRTQELLGARRIDGAEQFFTRARDFGYSKSAQETLSIWSKDEVLSDVVWVIRRFRPDVIITRFSTQGGDTHGHHTASAMLALLAFRAAADPAFHPEQVEKAGTWQATRILWNRYSWGAPTPDMTALPQLDTGVYNPLLGMSYGEIAAKSRSMHKSQGFGSAGTRGKSPEYFQLLDGSPGLLSGIDFSWRRVPGGERLASLLEQARNIYNPRRPTDVLPVLFLARAELAALPENPWKQQKLKELTDVIAACAGLWLEASASAYSVAQGGAVTVTASAMNRGAAPLRLREVRIGGKAIPADKLLAQSEPWQIEEMVQIPLSTPVSNPYWLANPPTGGLYNVPDRDLIGLAENPPVLSAEFLFSMDGGKDVLSISRPVQYKWTDPVAGERRRALQVTPAVMASPESQVLMFADGQPKTLRVRLTAGAENVKGAVRLSLPQGFSAEPASAPFSFDKKGSEEEVRFTIRPPAAAQLQTGTLSVMVDLGGEKGTGGPALGTQQIDYPHIPIQALFPAAEVRLVRFDLKKTRTRIGYIPGAGDDVPAALRQVGYDVTVLSDEAIEQKPLSPYAAIIVGVRAYNTNSRLPFLHKKLMDYVAAGGNLVVQYNTNNRLGKLTAPIGPLPFEISQDRVTEENAAVTFTSPSHALLTAPNRITDADFAGWVQERGLYFAGSWDAKYETPLSMHDTGESEKRGSVLCVRHGKGSFVYTGLSFFRQLPAGVPGAYRLFANMISYGQ